jgi:putative serine protease PepD
MSDGGGSCGVTAIPYAQQDYRHTAGSLSSHRAIPVTTQRLTPARVASFMLCNLGVAATAAVIGVVVVLVLPYAAVGRSLFMSDSARTLPPAYSATSWVERVAAKVLPSIVTLEISDGNRSLSGSGIILTPDGVIMTNNHVVAGIGAGPQAPARALVTFNDGRTAAAYVIAADPQSDVAIVRAQNVSDLRPVSIGSSTNLRVGHAVAAVGSPLGLRGTVTAGIVSALDRLVCPATGRENRSAFYAIQTDAAINPGNSGGALVDTNGDLVGVNAAESVVASADDSNSTEHGSIGLGFAIPVDHAARIAAELLATGRASHAWLGAKVSSDTGPYGAKIIGVESGSPAEAAGLTAGAQVTKINDQRIGSGDTLLAAVQSMEPGDRVTLVLTDSSGNTRTVQVNLSSDRG